MWVCLKKQFRKKTRNTYYFSLNFQTSPCICPKITWILHKTKQAYNQKSSPQMVESLTNEDTQKNCVTI